MRNALFAGSVLAPWNGLPCHFPISCSTNAFNTITATVLPQPPSTPTPPTVIPFSVLLKFLPNSHRRSLAKRASAWFENFSRSMPTSAFYSCCT
uniref:Secreted protein n=1 Tax=Ascaris lumbricoides TaxID=6252 RepID=A0A0M3HTR4_ASCLU